MERQIVAVPVHFDLLFEMMKQGYKIGHDGTWIECTKGLPENAVCVGSFTDESSHTATLLFQHESFEPVPLGHPFPERVIEFTRRREAD